MQTGGLQVCLWQTSSAQSCGLRRGASRPSSGGAVVNAAVRVSSGILLSFFLSGFPLGAGRKGSVVGGTQRAFSSRRTGAGSPGRAFALAAQKPGAGRGRWAGRRGAAGVSGGGLFPRRQRQFRSGRAKKQATKRRTKRDFPSPKRRRFVKTGFSARYKEARRSPRRRARPGGQKPGPGKDDRRSRLLHFAEGKSCGVVGFRASPRQSPVALSAFALRRGKVLRRCRLSRFAAKKSSGRVGFAPQGGIESPGAFSPGPGRPLA